MTEEREPLPSLIARTQPLVDAGQRVVCACGRIGTLIDGRCSKCIGAGR